MTTKFAKFGTVLAGAAMAFSFALPTAGAVTVAELQNQINLLMAQLSTLQGGSTVSTTFTADLTIGSKGDQVSALQQALVAKNFLKMPAGVAYGYFGNLTKSAVAAWQAANGITPSVGYFGPKSRAAFGGVVAGTPGTPATPAATGITTPGAEGTLSITAGTVSNSTIYSTDMGAPILSFKAKAQNSDIAIQRIKLDLGTDSKVYTRAYSKISLVDEAGTVLASSDLNSTTVVKGTEVTPIYYITLTGFSSVVPKDTTKTFTVKVDVRSFSSTDSSVANVAWTVRLATDGVRGVDGAGIDQYAGDTTITKSVTTAAALSDSATVTLSTGANTPLTQEVVAATGSANNQADKVSLLTFDIKASKDNVTLTDLVATIAKTASPASTATASSTYLYVGDTLVGTASLALGTATFSDINVAIAKDTTKTFTLKADIQTADANQATFTASVAASGMTAENSVGDLITGGSRTGSATSNSILVRSDGPMFTLVSKTISYAGASGLAGGTTTAKASFVIRANAVGSDVYFGTQAASTTFSFGTYKGSVLTTLLDASSTSYVIPSNGVVTAGMTGANAFKISENGTADISVDYLFENRTAAGVLLGTDAYSVGLAGVNWSLTGNTTTASTFMAGKTDWRTSTVTMP